MLARDSAVRLGSAVALSARGAEAHSALNQTGLGAFHAGGAGGHLDGECEVGRARAEARLRQLQHPGAGTLGALARGVQDLRALALFGYRQLALFHRHVPL